MKITFVIGGARSGKSSFALNQASKVEGPKVYIATAEALDEEMKARIEKHRVERGSEWDTYEEPIRLPDVLKNLTGRYSVAVLDCLTIWLSNLLVRSQIASPDRQAVNEAVMDLIDVLKGDGKLNLFIVSNEVGMGIVPENSLARLFRDLAGDLNQKVASVADEVYLVTAGIPIRIKG
jgi:adenosylcobinamide kinase/adenosylcobinamide-phosphate guanylyltransferase